MPVRLRLGVRMGAERAGDTGGVRDCELLVGVVPQFACLLVQAEAAGGAGVLDRAAEHGGQAGAVKRVSVAAFGEQAGSPAGAEHESIGEPVGELDVREVVAQLVLGDVPDQRDVRLARSRGGGAGQQLQRPAIPAGAECWR